MSSSSRFHELMSRLLDDVVSDEELAELHIFFETNPAFRSQAVEHWILDTLLGEDLGQEPLTALVDTISETTSPPPPQGMPISRANVPRLWPPVKRWGWLAVAASLIFMLTLLFLQSDRQAFASAARLVQAAIQTHAAPVERIYIVEVKRGSTGETLVDLPRDVRVTTQGDRFWVQMHGKRDWAWGRDEHGAIWITLGTKRAVVVHPDEMGVPLRYIGDLYTLNLETLLNDFLKHCHLEMSDGPADATMIVATPRRQWTSRPLQRATIEVDRETKAIRKLVIEREFERAISISTFTLIESKLADESLYAPEGHLTAPYRVFSTQANATRRRELIDNWFGATSEPWMRLPETHSHE